jgi:hypothetical protein
MPTSKEEVCLRKLRANPQLLTISNFRDCCDIGYSIKEIAETYYNVIDEIAEMEKQIPRLKELAKGALPQNSPSIMRQKNGEEWKIIGHILKTKAHEKMLCSREEDGKKQFAIIQIYQVRTPPLKHFGEGQIYIFSDSAPTTLDKLLEHEKFCHENYDKNDLRFAIEQRLSVKISEKECDGVFKAVASFCKEQKTGQVENVPAQKSAARFCCKC